MSEAKLLKLEWVDKETHWLLKIDGEFRRCVSCDMPIEHDKNSKKANHQCSSLHESYLAGANHRHQDLGETRTVSEADLIDEGFKMLGGDEE